MSDGKIYITISDTRNGSGGGVSPDTQGNDVEKNKGVNDYFVHRFYNFVESQGQRFVNYSVNNIGNFTGNYEAQRDAESIMRQTSFLINLSSSIIAGGKIAGVPGAILAGTLVVSSEAINFAYSERTEQFQNRKVNRNIDMMRRRLGLEGLTDGSRTGGY